MSRKTQESENNILFNQYSKDRNYNDLLMENERLRGKLDQAEKSLRILKNFNEDKDSWTLFLNPDAKALYCSESVFEFTGVRAQDILENPGLIFKLLDEEFGKKLKFRLSDDLKSRSPGMMYLEFKDKNYEVISVRYRSEPKFNNSGEFSGLKVVFERELFTADSNNNLAGGDLQYRKTRPAFLFHLLNKKGFPFAQETDLKQFNNDDIASRRVVREKYFMNLVHSADSKKIENFISSSLKDKKGAAVSPVFNLSIDSDIHYPVTATLFKDDTYNNNFLRFILCLTGVEEKENTEERYPVIEDGIRHMADNMKDGIAIFRDEEMIYVNRGMRFIFGNPGIENLKRYLLESVETVTRKESRGEFGMRTTNTLLKEKAVWIRSGTNEKKCIQNKISASIGKNGSLYRYIITNDITSRKKAERALTDSEERFRLLVENIPDGIIIFSGRKIVYSNQSVYKILGLNSEYSIEGEDITSVLGREVINLGQGVNDYDNLRKFFTGKFSLRIYKTEGSECFIEGKGVEINFRNIDSLQIVFHDVTERIKMETLLRENEKIFRDIYENSAAGIFRLNSAGDIILANPALLRILGYEKNNNIKGANFSDLVFGEEEKNKFIHTFLEGEDVRGYETRVTRKDGALIDVLVGLKIFRTNNGEQSYIEGTLEDISRMKAAEKTLIEARLKAEESDRLKSEFLTQISHEIRTPLSAILNSVNLIKDEVSGKIDEEIEELFFSIDSSGRRIVRTVHLLINMSELQTGTYDYSPSKINITNLLQNVYEELNSEADKKELEFEIFAPVEPVYIIADRYSIYQIFENLVNNAIKFTNSGSVRAGIKLNSSEKIIFEVEDTGKGISKEFLPYLFRPFYQEERGYTRKFDGNGLGLALVKKYCELYDAEIKVESNRNEGSLFRVVFP